MTSWKLLRHLTPFWGSDADTPVFVRELHRPPMWREFETVLLTVRSVIPALALIAMVYMCAMVVTSHPIATFCWNNALTLPILLLPSLVLWTLPLSLALAPVVVHEREQRTWEILRATPLNTETILLSKIRGATTRLHTLMQNSRHVLVFASTVVALFSLNMLESLTSRQPDVSPLLVCGTGIVVMALSAILFLLDRAQQFVLMAAAVLTISASASSLRMALPGASVVSFFAWLVDVTVAAVLLAHDPVSTAGPFSTQLHLLIMLGPTAGYMATLSFGKAMLYMAATFVAREIAVCVMWSWILCSARQI